MFLLDTGASHSCITKSVAKQLKLHVIATTKISASLFGLKSVKVVRTRTIQFFKRTLRNFPLWVHPRLAGFDGVIGMDILIKYRIMIIDFQTKELLLMKFGRRRKK